MKALTRSLAAAFLVAALVTPTLATEDTVYVTDNGKKYHQRNCKMKSGSHGMKLSEAKKKGYTACSVCFNDKPKPKPAAPKPKPKPKTKG